MSKNDNLSLAQDNRNKITSLDAALAALYSKIQELEKRIDQLNNSLMATVKAQDNLGEAWDRFDERINQLNDKVKPIDVAVKLVKAALREIRDL